MKTRLVAIGNSRGVRIPKPMIEEAKLLDDVEIKVKEGAIVITSILQSRAGWAEQARSLHNRGDDRLILKEVKNKFDENEWVW